MSKTVFVECVGLCLLITVAALARVGDKQAPVDRVEGVVYGRLTSPSGKGVESVTLTTTSGTYDFVYPKLPRPKLRFKDSSCEDLGAIWIAEVRIDSPATGSLLSAKCDGCGYFGAVYGSRRLQYNATREL